MCYDVKHVPPPLRCFKCQKYGHVAAVCKGKQRCGRCGGEHEYGKCVNGAKLKCCNCGGEHSSAYRGCEASKRAVEIQRIKTSEGITYAEANKRVGWQPDRPNNKQVSAECKKSRTCEGCDKIKEDTMLVGKK